jgi:hypothetical protein
MGFHVAWFVSLAILVAVAAWAGRQIRGSTLGILIDSRGRYSLNHLQTALWTFVGLSAVMGVAIARAFLPEADLLDFKIPPELLQLMGISLGTATLVGAAKNGKDVPGSARIARVGVFTQSNGTQRTITARFAQVFMEEEGDQADQVVSITKFQNVMITALAALAYLAQVWKEGGPGGLPAPTENFVWLVGISHAGYLGGKLPTK